MVFNRIECAFVVEDSSDDLNLISRALTRHNATVEIITATDGADALESLSKMEAGVDLILLDLKLPKVSGFDVLRAVRACPALRDQRVIIFSSSDETQDISSALELGATGYVQKPVDYDKFQDVVKRIAEGWNGDHGSTCC